MRTGYPQTLMNHMVWPFLNFTMNLLPRMSSLGTYNLNTHSPGNIHMVCGIPMSLSTPKYFLSSRFVYIAQFQAGQRVPARCPTPFCLMSSESRTRQSPPFWRGEAYCGKRPSCRQCSRRNEEKDRRPGITLDRPGERHLRNALREEDV